MHLNGLCKNVIDTIQSISQTDAEVPGDDWLVQEVHPKLRTDSGTDSRLFEERPHKEI